jgi:hypothetical protein
MTAALLSQWQDRVVEAETELQVINEELQGVEGTKTALVRKSEKFSAAAKKEKTALMGKLAALETKADGVDKKVRTAGDRAANAERTIAGAAEMYETLSLTVRLLKGQEDAIDNREDFAALLDAEQAAWAAEEAELRGTVALLEERVAGQRQELKASIAGGKTRLKDAELQLKTDRMGRSDGEGAELLLFRHGAIVSAADAAPAALPAAGGAAGALKSALKASSAVRGKSASRKRDVLGDATNM